MGKKLEHFLRKYPINHYQSMFKRSKVLEIFSSTKNKFRYFIARDGSRLLQKLSSNQRQAIINKMALNLTEYSKDILQANKNDLEEATKGGSFKS